MPRGPIDLHAHSSVSDGTETPTQLMRAAVAAGLDTIAITDHDSTAGWDEALTAAAGTGLQVVRGMELSTRYEWRSVHVLGYLFDPNNGDLVAETARVRADRLGSFSSVAVAVGEPELLARSTAPKVEVLDPALDFRVSGPEFAPTPQPGPLLVSGPETDAPATTTGASTSPHATYRLTLRNTSRVTARAARVSLPIRGLRVVSTSAPAVVGEETLTLGCDSIEPGASAQFEIVVVANGVTPADLHATAVADHVAPVRAVLRPLGGARVAAASHP